ncbi:hypothetical protein SISSUDRAFT_1068049 [Sistotremastrum suecicum HHB10207 ss-3]|uniref:Uncharacterized protein n=1 Tax=Sistotremastrum suecicum HHB10207 ss-3 TaxID=1314776 RepID=A0A165WGV0_9AGAM|nr:hypothetical protein SISSUDRAFT_1068049 [Sistotremastrum suecicum HHB10207 ss-3]
MSSTPSTTDTLVDYSIPQYADVAEAKAALKRICKLFADSKIDSWQRYCSYFHEYCSVAVGAFEATAILERTVKRLFFTAFDEPDKSHLIHLLERASFPHFVYCEYFLFKFYHAGSIVYKDRLRSASIDPADNLLANFTLDRAAKRGISFILNRQLSNLFSHETITARDVLRFRNSIVEDLGLDDYHPHPARIGTTNYDVVSADDEDTPPSPRTDAISIYDSSDDDPMDTHDESGSSSSSFISNDLEYNFPLAALSTDSLSYTPLTTSTSSYEGLTAKKPTEFVTAPTTVPSPEPSAAPLVSSNTFSAVVELPGYGNYAINIDSSGLERPSQITGFRLD